jgi:hypothetical protein
LTVALHGFWILPPPLFLIVRMFLSPLLLTFQGDLVILGVSRKFLAVIIGAAPTLALRPDCTRFVEDDERRVETNYDSKDNGGTGSSRLLRGSWG